MGMLLLIGEITGVKNIGIPAVFRIEHTAADKQQQKTKQNMTAHLFVPYNPAVLPVMLGK